MPRNAEVVRQWRILLEIEASRRGTIDHLAEMCGVTTRTIRRDLDALQEAGFPLYDEKVDGHTWWKLSGHAFKGLAETGFTLSELCAFYFSRTLLEALAGAPFSADLKTGFDKLSGALTPRMRQFFDKLPSVLTAKSEAKKRRSTLTPPDNATRFVEAILSRRQVKMRYHSFSSGRVKDYVVDPQRLVFAQGALYLFAYVPEYVQVRTFAVHRIKSLTVLEERFDPIETLPDKPFPNSIGVHTGEPEAVEIEFAPNVAPYIRERECHPSQRISDGQGGSIVLSLNVCIDWALQSWILSFGPFARVIRPLSLAARTLDEIEEAREQYIPHGEFEPAPRLWESSEQRAFPFHEAAHGES
jgi:predicted DNA-binding transcriptional regulator YafY